MTALQVNNTDPRGTDLVGLYAVNGGHFSGNRNKLINGAFAHNQRVVSGTVVLTAGQYGHDYWKAGAGGCTYTFVTVNNLTTITITAGTLTQVINGKNLFSGVHVLSWGGTATARVGTGAYSAPSANVITANIVGGTNTTVEFAAGSLWLAQFEPGTAPSMFEFRHNELQLCQQRYFKTYEPETSPATGANATGYVGRFVEGNSNYATIYVGLPVAMEGVPQVTIYSASSATINCFSRDGVNIAATVQQAGRNGFYARAAAVATTVDQHVTAHFIAVAGL